MVSPSSFSLHPTSPPLFVLARAHFVTVCDNSTVVLHTNAHTRHQTFPRSLGLLFDVFSHDLVASPEHERYKSDTNKQCEAEQDDVDRYGIVLERLVGRSVESRLGEVEETG